MWNKVFIALGSNLANPKQQVLTAIKELQQLPQTRWCRVSSLYQSKPMGPADQSDFINAVAAIETQLAPLDLLDNLQALEQRQHRVRSEELRWGPRTLDLDILLYGQEQINLPRLIIPHPGLKQRAFVLYPLAEIAPDLILPSSESIQQLLAVIPNTLQRLDN